MNRTEYNGYTNYETWLVSLHIDNDQGSSNYAGELADESQGERDLATKLKDWIEDDMPDLPGLYGDLLRAALTEVDWYDIAETLKPDDGWIPEREEKQRMADLVADVEFDPDESDYWWEADQNVYSRA